MSDAILLLRARAILSQWHRLHLLSVTIGRLEPVADSGVAEAEIRGARLLVEMADRWCADLDRSVMEGESGEKVVSVAGENVESQQG